MLVLTNRRVFDSFVFLGLLLYIFMNFLLIIVHASFSLHSKADYYSRFLKYLLYFRFLFSMVNGEKFSSLRAHFHQLSERNFKSTVQKH